ncbi:MAG: WD40/YVTN/BNR-like repeat-containing protein, partial [Gaiellaceae bacterium]
MAALACMALLIPAVLTAMATKTGGGAAAPPTRLGTDEEFSYLGQGSDESGEAGPSAAQEDYANRAYPSDTIGFGQTQGAIAAGKKVKDKGSKLNAKWKELGPDTLEIGQFGTQNLMVPTQWTGRIAALAVDSRHCNVDACKLYIGSAGGGVWMTNNALAQRPAWHEQNDGLDTRAIGSITIDPTDATGNTIYVGTGEENGSSDNEAGLGVYKSTDGGNHWSVLPGSVAAAKDRGVGDIAIDPTNPSHIYIGTMVARHGISSTNGGRFTPPGAPRLGLYESKDGGNTFTLIYSRDQDPVVPGT